MSSKKPTHAPQGRPVSESVTDFAPEPIRTTKVALLLELISRKEGATLDELTSVTGWFLHTARPSISGLCKRGYDVCCSRVGGVSLYTLGTSGQ